MGEVAASFECRLGAVRRARAAATSELGDREQRQVRTVQQAFAEAASKVTRPRGAVIFSSVSFGPQLKAVGRALAPLTAEQQFPIVLVSGPSVLSNRGELEGELAVTGIVFGGGRVALRTTAVSDIRREQIQQLVESENGRFPPCLLFIRSEGFEPEEMWRARALMGNPSVFGAGTYGAPGIVCVDNGEVKQVTAASLRLSNLLPQIRTAHSCRLLGPLMEITRAEGTTVYELDGKPALSVLEELGNSTEGRPLLFTILSEQASAGQDAQLLVRGIHGIDPDRKALVVSAEVREGTFMTFGMRDAKAAREQLQSLTRRVQRDLAGAAPRFGLYFNCSGRGQEFHGSPHVDTRILRERFGELPVAGFQSAFEIAPYFGAPALQLYTGVLALFSSPS